MSDETRQQQSIMSGHSVNQTLNKVIAERRKKRKQKAEAKRTERREKLIKE